MTAGDDDDDDSDGGDNNGGDADADEGRGKKTSAGPSIDHSTLIEDTRALQKQRSKRTVGIFETLLYVFKSEKAFCGECSDVS